MAGYGKTPARRKPEPDMNGDRKKKK